MLSSASALVKLVGRYSSTPASPMYPMAARCRMNLLSSTASIPVAAASSTTDYGRAPFCSIFFQRPFSAPTVMAPITPT